MTRTATYGTANHIAPSPSAPGMPTASMKATAVASSVVNCTRG